MMFFILSFLFIQVNAAAQTITGELKDMAGQEIRLELFEGAKNRMIAHDTILSDGTFSLNYQLQDVGIGYLIAGQSKPFTVVLSGENIVVSGSFHNGQAFLNVLSGKDNLLLAQYAKEQPVREQALAAWYYLQNAYDDHGILSAHRTPKHAIQREILRLKQEESTFMANLPKKSPLRYYLPLRKMIGSVSALAQYRTDEIPAAITAFRRLDHGSDELYRSGLLNQLIESHFWLLENMGKVLDTVHIEMQRSIDSMLMRLVKHDQRMNELTQYLLDLLERQSLFPPAEYLSLKVLNETGCTIQQDLARQMESYRSMKKGMIAPDISFDGYLFAPAYVGAVPPKKLSAIRSDYYLIVFAAGWCPTCVTEIPKIAARYQQWKSTGMEVILVSLDENLDSFSKFAGGLPFISVCDFGKWTSKTVSDYFVYGTPTMFLLNARREILLRPTSVGQIDAWVDLIISIK